MRSSAIVRQLVVAGSKKFMQVPRRPMSLKITPTDSNLSEEYKKLLSDMATIKSLPEGDEQKVRKFLLFWGVKTNLSLCTVSSENATKLKQFLEKFNYPLKDCSYDPEQFARRLLGYSREELNQIDKFVFVDDHPGVLTVFNPHDYFSLIEKTHNTKTVLDKLLYFKEEVRQAYHTNISPAIVQDFLTFLNKNDLTEQLIYCQRISVVFELAFLLFQQGQNDLCEAIIKYPGEEIFLLRTIGNDIERAQKNNSSPNLNYYRLLITHKAIAHEIDTFVDNFFIQPTYFSTAACEKIANSIQIMLNLAAKIDADAETKQKISEFCYSYSHLVPNLTEACRIATQDWKLGLTSEDFCLIARTTKVASFGLLEISSSTAGFYSSVKDCVYKKAEELIQNVGRRLGW